MSNVGTIIYFQVPYLETLLFGEPDKIPLSPGGPRESTRHAWHKQSLPEGVEWYDHLMEIIICRNGYHAFSAGVWGQEAKS